MLVMSGHRAGFPGPGSRWFSLPTFQENNSVPPRTSRMSGPSAISLSHQVNRGEANRAEVCVAVRKKNRAAVFEWSQSEQCLTQGEKTSNSAISVKQGQRKL